MKVTQRELAGDGVRLVADVLGDQGGIPVVFLHGGGQTRTSWQGVIEAIAARGFLAIAVDQRGHGESGRAPNGDYLLDHFANDVRHVSEQLPPRAFFVGASLGGLASLAAIAEPPAVDARGLVLVDVVPRLESDGTERIVAFMGAAPDGFASLDEAGEAVAKYLPHRQRPKDLEGLRNNLRVGQDGRWRWHWDPRFLETMTTRGLGIEAERLEADARRLRVPTLLVRGGLSRVVSAEGARKFLKDVPHAEFVDVAKADHMVAGDRNDAFLTAILAFLERHSAA